MSINFKFPQINMELYETDINILQKFLLNEKKEGEFTEEYLILYDFAMDCKYANYIQPDLIRYMLPFYLKAVEQAVLYENKIAIDIYFEFNLAIFFNQKIFMYAVGEKDYQHVMEYYIKLTIEKMEMQNLYMLEWISLFNTTVAFYDDNIRQLFIQIFEGSSKIKYSFFQYISIFLFKESDNLLVVNETREFWTSDVWDFDDGYFSNRFFWNNNIIEFFDKEINEKRIKDLFKDIKPFICDILELEIVELFYEEMNKSFVTNIFRDRKVEFLQKINNTSEKYIYWDVTC